MIRKFLRNRGLKKELRKLESLVSSTKMLKREMEREYNVYCASIIGEHLRIIDLDLKALNEKILKIQEELGNAA
jgi:hypothetical protein